MASYTRQALLVLKRVGIVIGIAIAFTLGLIGAIYLSLRSSETRVPDITGKDRTSAENTISDAGLNFRVRALRATSEAKPDTVLIQLPHAGEIVKVGQTVAVDISRPPANGEASTPVTTPETEAMPQTTNNNSAPTPSPTPKRKPANANANGNANSNRNQNRNTNGNSNRPVNNGNANSSATPRPANSNAGNANRPPRNVNANRRPAGAPTP
jgi:beta-lactam-binding protein with PASTA domain